MNRFRYVENDLYCEEVKLSELMEEFGTPLYVYSKAQLLENLNCILTALQTWNASVCYALKANANLTILRTLAEAGAGADVASEGELYLALKVGFAPEKIVFTGVGKREDEIEYALRENIFCIYAESHQELQLISRIAYRMGKVAQVGLRVNPDIDAESHPYITTGLSHHKFGLNVNTIEKTLTYARELPSLQIIGLHTHIGSQISKVEPYKQTSESLANLVVKLREKGIQISNVDVGGGFGVQYEGTLQHEALSRSVQNNKSFPPASAFIEALSPLAQVPDLKLWIEPGRSVVANAGILLTKILYTKENGQKKFVIVDAGMNDLIRPSLYNAYHEIVPLTIDTYEREFVDVVGPVCESGDFFARDRMMLKTAPNRCLAIMTTGAYGMVNASNYNGRLRPAEVLVSGEKVKIIRHREILKDLE